LKDARYHHAQGNALVDEGKTDRAISSFRRALRIDDSLAEAHNDLGAAYFQKGWYSEAEACFRKAIECDPGHGIAYANRGAALRRLGRLSESRRAYQRALVLKIRALLPPLLRWKVQAPAAPEAAPRGNAPTDAQRRITDLLAVGRSLEALPLARALAERYPDDPDARYLHATALHDTSGYALGLQELEAALALKADRAEYHILAARLHAGRGSLEATQASVNRALKLEPGSAAIYATLAAVFHPWREDLAVEAARKAIELDPKLDAAHGNLAAALWGLGQLEAAAQANAEALRLSPRNINHRANRALILKDLDRLPEAREIYRGLLAEVGSNPKICADLGTLAVEVDGDFAEGRRLYRRALELSENQKAKQYAALLDLLEGDFDAWDRYEVRKQSADQRVHHAQFKFPEWVGEPLNPGRLLVYGEQGLGDEVMFASVFGDLARRVSQIAVLCDARLAALFQRSFPQFEIIGAPRERWGERVGALSGFACQIAAGSLPRLFRTAAADFPRHRGYLVAAPAKIAAWRERLEALGAGMKIGISWQGGLQRTGRSRRSLPLERLASLLQLPGTHWVSLQHGDAKSGTEVHAFPGVTEDLDELASLIQALDLVVSVCNTNVHLSGALGKEVLVMAPFVPEWRYGASGARMIWYPSARVFRQAAYGDWDSVIGRVADELRRRL
jgi:Flp pilus assembly protein TadD